MAIDIRRRKLLASLTSAAAWPFSARAQQSDRVRHIGVLMNTRPDESEGQVRVTALVQGLQKLGWTDGRNAQVDIRWAADDADLYRSYMQQNYSRRTLL
jgi:putative tryptophan/tyrosine transport system substrate-binding protein